MSEQDQTGAQGATNEGTTPEVDPIKNLKGEFNRKIDSVDSGLKALSAQLEKLAGTIQKPAPAQTIQEDDLADLAYTNPKKFAERVKEQAVAAVSQTITNRDQQNSRQQRVISEIVSEFPEVQSNDSPLYKKAVEYYAQLDDGEKAQHSSWKSVVYKAAMDLDMKPKSKRPVQDDQDDFVLGGSSSSTANNRPTRKKSEIDPMTEEFSRLLGRDTNDPKVKEGLKQASQRRQWNRYK